MNLMIVPGILVCSSFLISVCMFVSKILAHIECYSDYSRRGAIWLNPFATVLCSAVTVECCVLYLCCVGVFGMFAVIYIRRLFSTVCNC